MKKVIRLTENDIANIVRRVITEGNTPPKDKVINLRCQNDIRKDSFVENDLVFNFEEDRYGGLDNGGFKRLYLIPSSNSVIPRETYDTQTFMLDIIKAENVNQDFLDKSKLDDPSNTIYFFGYKYSSPYFCAVDYGTDSEWETYLNTF